MGIMKGQGSSEYIVMLAVVLIVVLVVAGILGFFPAFGGDTQQSQSDAYWQSASPFAIVASSQTNSGTQAVDLVIENHASKELTITQIVISPSTAPATISNGTSITLSAGGKTTYQLSNTTLGNCSGRTGKGIGYDVTITYNSEDITGKKQVGAKPVLVLCK